MTVDGTPIPRAVDLQGSTQLRQRAAHEDPGALTEAAVQFDALFIGMMLKSARDASLGKGIFDSEDSSQYLELMDHQVALELARKRRVRLRQAACSSRLAARRASDCPGATRSPYTSSTPHGRELRGAPDPRCCARCPLAMRSTPLGATASRERPTEARHVAATRLEHFVRALFARRDRRRRARSGSSRACCSRRPRSRPAGAPRRRNTPTAAPTNNLFGMKAGDGWRGGRVAHWTIEHLGGVDDAQARRVPRLRPRGRQLRGLRRL